MLKAKAENEDEEDEAAVKRKDVPRVSRQSALLYHFPALPGSMMLIQMDVSGPWYVDDLSLRTHQSWRRGRSWIYPRQSPQQSPSYLDR